MKDLIGLVIQLMVVFGVFIAGIGVLALLWTGINVLPQYIGGFGTFMLYVSLFTIVFCLIFNHKNNTK